MSLDHSPKWVQEQVRTGLEIDKKLNIKEEIDKLSIEALITFFEKNRDAKFSKEDPETPENSAAHIIAYQKALNILKIPVGIDGMYGTNTRKAIVRFQKEQGFQKPNGVPGQKTAEKLIEALKGQLPKEAKITLPIRAEQSKLPETPEQKIDKFLKREGYERDDNGNYVNSDKDLTIIIKDKTVEYTRSFGRAFGSWELNDAEQRIVAELSKILEIK